MQNRKFLIFVLYLLPYAYMAMVIDILKGSILSYVLMMLIMGALMLLSVRTGNVKTAVLGNILSFGISYLSAANFPQGGEAWAWFFKPFTPSQMVTFLYIVSFVIQLIIYLAKKKKALNYKSER